MLESLAYSGGFDSFGHRREQFFAPNAKGEVFLDTLLRYGQRFQQEKAMQMNSLFGDDNAVEVAHPPIPEGDRWPTIEKLNKERELVGIYLSAHPLDEYGVVLTDMCNTRCTEVGRDADREALAKRETITFGGIVTNVVERFSSKTGKPFGLVTIEDFDGAGEIALRRRLDTLSGMMKHNYNIFIRAKMQQRFRNSNSYEMKIENVQQLYDVKNNSLKSITISVDTTKVTEETIANLTSSLQAHPGTTEVFVSLITQAGQDNLLLRSSNCKINVDRKLLMSITDQDGLGYSIN